MPSSGFAHNSRFRPRRIFLRPNPALLPAAHSPARSFLSHLFPHSRSPLFLLRHPTIPPLHPLSRFPLPAQLAPPHNSPSALLIPPSACSFQRLAWNDPWPFHRRRPPNLPTVFDRPPFESLLRHTALALYSVPKVPRTPRPTPAWTAACHKRFCRLPGAGGSPRRLVHTPAAAPPPIPPPHESPATRAAGETAQSLRGSASPSPRSTHSPGQPRPFPATAAASEPKRQWQFLH